MTEPEWLQQRGGSFRPGPDGQTWYVILSRKPQYRLVAVPVQGKFGCVITETINGKRLQSERVALTAEAALQAGLEDLARSLGWLGE